MFLSYCNVCETYHAINICLRISIEVTKERELFKAFAIAYEIYNETVQSTPFILIILAVFFSFSLRKKKSCKGSRTSRSDQRTSQNIKSRFVFLVSFAFSRYRRTCSMERYEFSEEKVVAPILSEKKGGGNAIVELLSVWNVKGKKWIKRELEVAINCFFFVHLSGFLSAWMFLEKVIRWRFFFSTWRQ